MDNQYTQNEVNNQQPASSQQMGEYQQNLEEPVSMGEWLISLLILCIPCVNIIMMFVWAFGKSEKKSKSNYFKASLIMAAIMMGFTVIMLILTAGSVASTIMQLR